MKKEKIETTIETINRSLITLTRAIGVLTEELVSEEDVRYKNFDEMKKYWEGVVIKETTLNPDICEFMKLMLKEYNTFESLHEKLEKAKKEKFPKSRNRIDIKSIMSHYRWLQKNGYTIHLNKHCKFKITGYVRPK